MIIKIKDVAIIFVFIFVARGLSQALFSSSVIKGTLILHTLSMLLLLLIFLLFINEVYKRKSLKVELIYLSLFLLYMLIISSINSYVVVTDLLNYSMPLIMTCSLLSIRKKINLEFLVTTVLVIFLMQVSLLAIKNGYGFVFNRESRESLGSIFGHANSLALIVACYFIIKQNSSIKSNLKLKSNIKNTLGVITLLIIGARSMLLSIFIGYSYWILNNGKISRFRFIASLAVYGLVVYLIVQYGISLLEESWDDQSYTSGNSLKWRIIHWSYYISHFHNLNDVLFGFGVGSHELVTSGLYDKYLEVHNDFLRIIYDIGIVGLILYLISDFLIVKKLKIVSSVDWRIYLVLTTKYFFMFFDNYVTNLVSLTGMSLLMLLYVKNMEGKQ